MQRPPDLLADPHLRARDFFRVLDQPWLTEPVPTENAPFLSRYVAEPDMRPAPLMGQQTRDICGRILGMTPEKIDDLMARGVLEEDQS
jgi:crotonobetainyl-CoA:carnitine CoA-transferase CaiB-like acyl-CoA transferase